MVYSIYFSMGRHFFIIITIFHVPKIVLEAHIIALLSWIIQNHYSSYLTHAP